VVFLSAVGLLITPIYLLSMLRRVFYGQQSESAKEVILDVQPRELSIAFCLLIPISGIGLYPKLITQTYDNTTVAVASHLRQALPTVAKSGDSSLYAKLTDWRSQTAVISPTIPGKLASVAP
jgi:NAD(P)H-quinone oxidoreductase subunit 4